MNFMYCLILYNTIRSIHATAKLADTVACLAWGGVHGSKNIAAISGYRASHQVQKYRRHPRKNEEVN